MKIKQDGGYAWIVCAASFFHHVIQGGILLSVGIFYIIFKRQIDGSPSTIALVPSLSLGFFFIVGPISGMLVERYGERKVAMAGSVVASLGLALSSAAQNVFHLAACYSFLMGTGMGISYNPAISTLAKYFDKKKKLATGIAVSGTGFGTFLFPTIVQALEGVYSWRGAMLLLAGINLHTSICGVLFRPVDRKYPNPNQANGKSHSEQNCHSQPGRMQLKSTDVLNQYDHTNGRPTTNVEKTYVGPTRGPRCCPRSASPRKYLAIFESVDFICYSIFTSVFMMAATVIYTHLGAYAVSLGYSERVAALLYLATGVSATISRFLSGALPQMWTLDPLLFTLISTVTLAVISALFPLVKALPLLISYAVFSGMLMAPYNTLCLPVVSSMVDAELLPTAFGIICVFSGPGCVLGGPVAAWLYETTSVYGTSFYLASGLMLTASLVMVPSLWCARKTRRAIVERNVTAGMVETGANKARQ